MKKKCFILLCITLCLNLSVMAFDVVVRTVSAGDKECNSLTIEKVEMAPTGVVTLFMTDGSSEVVPADDFVALRFRKDVTSVDSVADTDAAFVNKDGRLLAPGADTVSLFSLDGALIASASGDEGIDLYGLPAGVYIANSGAKSFKFILK